MESKKINNSETGWIDLPAKYKKFVAHFKSGEKKKCTLFEFIMLNRKHQVVQLDCYEENEQIPE